METSTDACKDPWTGCKSNNGRKGTKGFSERLSKQINTLSQFEYSGKFGGATGNFNAHIAAFPSIDWAKWADLF